MNQQRVSTHISLTSHPGQEMTPAPIVWGASSAKERGPVVGLPSDSKHRNAIGTHSGSYAVYRALAVATGTLDPLHKPDLTNTAPAVNIGPHPQWFSQEGIVSIDPWGHLAGSVFDDFIESGNSIRPTIAVTRARLTVPELRAGTSGADLEPDGKILLDSGEVNVTKVAIEPVWYLRGIAKRFGVEEHDLRRALYEQTGNMFSELVTRPDLKLFLPPIGGITLYIFGDPSAIASDEHKLSCRVHDECNGSDVFGSDICTCRPYLIHGIEDSIRTAQESGTGLIVYNRKEGRALGEVTKFLVYNARKRQEGGDSAEHYFERTECIAGVQDMRFQRLMPDALNWLGVNRIDRFVSMSYMKYDALVQQGIEIVERISLPEDRIPHDARVEMDAKIAAGYFSEDTAPSTSELAEAHGRGLEEY